MIDDLLTTTEVEQLLKIDRTTVYRMLKDGRLRGVKVGQQWRFPRSNVETMLMAVPIYHEQATMPPQLPLHCVQVIQDLFADLAQVAAIVIDRNGILFTLPNGSPEHVVLLQSHITDALSIKTNLVVCTNGQVLALAPILIDSCQIGSMLAGPVALQQHAALASQMRQVAKAIESLAYERKAMLARLNQIAALSTFADESPARW